MLNNVFIVDDDPISNLVSETVLKKSEFAKTYHTFENPRQALEKLDSLKPDLIFLDIVMPEMDGWEFLNQCLEKNLEAYFKVILLTASLKPEDEEKANTYTEVADIISKPLSVKFIQELKLKLEQG